MVADRVLIWRFKRGSRKALCRIYEKYKDDLLKIAVALSNDAAMAEDAVQETFVRFAQRPEKVQTHGNLKGYLVTCVANRIRNARRDRQRHETGCLAEADGMACSRRLPEQWAVITEELERLRYALEQLPYEQREVVTLRMEADMTFRQIAALQQASINTVQGRYRYGLAKLRSLLNGEVHS